VTVPQPALVSTWQDS